MKFSSLEDRRQCYEKVKNNNTVYVTHILLKSMSDMVLETAKNRLKYRICNCFFSACALPSPLTFSQVRSISTNVRRNLAFHTLSQEVLLKEFSTISWSCHAYLSSHWLLLPTRLLGWRAGQGRGPVPKVGEKHRHKFYQWRPRFTGAWTAGARMGKLGIILFGERMGGHRETPPEMWGFLGWAFWTTPHISNWDYKLWLLTNCQELLGKPQGDAHIHGVSGSPRLLKTD